MSPLDAGSGGTVDGVHATSTPTPYELYPPIRTIGPPDAPFEGALCRGPDGDTLLRVDQESVLSAGWRLAADPHVLAPLDVLRRPDGHDLLFPATALRWDRLLGRRRAAGAELRDGEAVTVAVSVVRGAAAACRAGAAEEPAAWWLTTDGRPVLVCGSGDTAALAASAQVFLGLAESASPVLRSVLEQVGEALSEPRRLLSHADELEDALFAAAEPEPLAVEVLTLSRAPAAAPPDDASPVPALRARERSRPWWLPLARAGDRRLADAAAEIADGVRRRLQGRRGRGRPIVVAVAVAGVLLIVGLTWPAGQKVPAVAETPASAPTDVRQPGEITVPGEETAPLEALTALLDARAACGDDECRGRTQEDPAAVIGGEAVSAPDRSVALLDDFGGLAVLRVTAPAAPTQFVTIVATADGWRIRDAFDAADPPSG